VRARLRAAWPDWSLWIAYGIVDPLLSGDSDLLHQRLDELWLLGKTVMAQRPWQLAGYALGHLDEAGLRRMPYAAEADLWLAVGRALRARLAGQGEAERLAWQDLLALSWVQRSVNPSYRTPALRPWPAISLNPRPEEQSPSSDQPPSRARPGGFT